MPTQSSGPTMVNFLTAASAAVLPLLLPPLLLQQTWMPWLRLP